MSQLFINPLFLWFSALVSVPIIIYLINRHRYRRRKWAAMEFLLRALRKNQRRLQLQNLLILLLRILVILLLVLAMARPVLRQNPLGLAAGENQNWVLVIDVSYSMDYREGVRSLFDQARETLDQMVEGLLQNGDSAALMTLAHEPRVLLGKGAVTPEYRQRLLREIEDLTLTSRSLRLVPSLALLEELLRKDFVGLTGAPEGCRIILFSDLQRKDWLEEDQPRSPEIREIIQRIQQRGGQFSVARLSAEKKLNVAVTDLSLKPELVAREVPVLLNVTVQNLGNERAENLDLTLRIRSAREMDPSGEEEGEAQLGEVLAIPARGSVTRPLPYRFDSSGHYTVVAEVRSDGLVLDNRRFLVVPVEDDVEVLLVDGDPAAELVDRETFYLEQALKPTDDDLGALGGRYTPFLPHYITDDQLGDIDLDRFSVVILANVPEVPKPVVSALKAYVREGGALMVFLGENVRADHYNEQFFEGEKGLLPLPLGDRWGDRETPVNLQFFDPGHPVARYFEEQKKRSFLHGGIVSFYHYVKVEQPAPDSDIRILARYNDLDFSPAIFDNSYGRGRAMWVTTTADKEWNDLAVWQDYVVFIYESISYLMGFSSRSLNLEVGEPFVRYYDGKDFAQEVLLSVPSSDRSDLANRVLRRAMRPVDREDSGGSQLHIDHENTSVPGLYRLDLKRMQAAQEDRVEYFAVNVNTEEGDLRGMASSDFEDYFGMEPTLFDASSKFRDMARKKDLLRGREYWGWALGAVLVLLLLETVLAQFFGRRAR